MRIGTVVKLVCGFALVGLAAPGVCSAQGGQPAGEDSGHRGDLLEEVSEAMDLFVSDAGDDEARYRYAELLFEAGDFERSRDVVSPLLDRAQRASDVIMLAARLAYLVGSYGEAERLFEDALSLDPGNVRALSGLVFTYYQTDRYERCLELPEELRGKVRLPHMDMMMAFGEEEPYQETWPGEPRTTVPFLMTDPLPIVRVEVDGRAINALIDTGADAFILDTEIADSLGIEIVASMMGMFAGGNQAEVGFAKADSLTIGGVTLHAVPLSVLPTKRLALGEHVIGGIIGTSLLRQFLSTLDYPNDRLILRARSGEAASAFEDEVRGRVVDEIQFFLQGTHFLLARGSLNGREDLIFHVDSGLAGEAAFTAPRQTLEYVGIPLPDVGVGEDNVGGGGGFAAASFPIETLRLGELTQHGLVGSFGGFPPEGYRRLGFIQDGLISHNFLRQYAWTLDFSRMRMVFSR